MFQRFQLFPTRDEEIDGKDEWAGITDANERRRRQNRINQRATRRRQKLSESPQTDNLALAYASSSAAESAPTTASTNTSHATSKNRRKKPSAESNEELKVPSYKHLSQSLVPTRTNQNATVEAPRTGVRLRRQLYFPLTPDTRLLHIITLNIFRGVLTNCVILTTVPSPMSMGNNNIEHDRSIFKLPSEEEMRCYLGSDVAAAAAAAELYLPATLMPTEVQQQVPHFSWIDVLPCPQFRDNLIIALDEQRIDEDEFMMDLIGAALHEFCSAVTRAATCSPVTDSSSVNEHSADSALKSESQGHPKAPSGRPSIGGPGIVSWSDPWDIHGWEFSQEFVQKWGSLFRGCDAVVWAANRWRDMRGEEPLVIELEQDDLVH